MRHRCRPPPNDSRNRSRFISRIRGLETPHDDGSSTSRRTKPSLAHHSPSPRPSVPCCAKRNGYKGSNHLSLGFCWTSGPDHLVQAVVISNLISWKEWTSGRHIVATPCPTGAPNLCSDGNAYAFSSNVGIIQRPPAGPLRSLMLPVRMTAEMADLEPLLLVLDLVGHTLVKVSRLQITALHAPPSIGYGL